MLAVGVGWSMVDHRHWQRLGEWLRILPYSCVLDQMGVDGVYAFVEEGVEREVANEVQGRGSNLDQTGQSGGDLLQTGSPCVWSRPWYNVVAELSTLGRIVHVVLQARESGPM